MKSGKIVEISDDSIIVRGDSGQIIVARKASMDSYLDRKFAILKDHYYGYPLRDGQFDIPNILLRGMLPFRFNVPREPHIGSRVVFSDFPQGAGWDWPQLEKAKRMWACLHWIFPDASGTIIQRIVHKHLADENSCRLELDIENIQLLDNGKVQEIENLPDSYNSITPNILEGEFGRDYFEMINIIFKVWVSPDPTYCRLTIFD